MRQRNLEVGVGWCKSMVQLQQLVVPSTCTTLRLTNVSAPLRIPLYNLWNLQQVKIMIFISCGLAQLSQQLLRKMFNSITLCLCNPDQPVISVTMPKVTFLPLIAVMSKTLTNLNPPLVSVIMRMPVNLL